MSASQLFEAAFGNEPQAIASAPGRVNLIGEYTDDNGGFVLPVAIAQRTYVAVRLRSGMPSRAVSAQRNAHEVEYFEILDSRQDSSFVGYLKGAFKALRAAGHDVHAADVAVDSDVPIGSGLASSTVLLVATLRACETALGATLPAETLAQLAHSAENDFVGSPVGKMDSMASALATTDSALFLNTRTSHYERVSLPDNVELVVIDSGIRHVPGAGQHRTRRVQCETAAARLGVRFLCDVEAESNLEALQGWSDLSADLRKRVRHVVTENQRVLGAVAALRAHDGAQFGRLLNASHASLRDDFQVSTPEVDALVHAACKEPDCLGARMTGGGFGGAIVALTRIGAAQGVAQRALHTYQQCVPAVRGTIVLPRVEPKTTSPYALRI